MFADNLKAARKNAGISQKELAHRLFISQQAYAKYETGAASPNPDVLAAIASELKVSVNDLLDLPRSFDSPPSSTGGIWVPVLGKVAAGIPIEAIQEIEDYEEISIDTASKGEHFALRIRGDSMEPRIKDGDVVIVRRQPDCNDGDVAVVLVDGEAATVKRIKKRPEGLMLIPNNTAYEPMFYSNEDIEKLPVTIAGKVVELRGKF